MRIISRTWVGGAQQHGAVQEQVVCVCMFSGLHLLPAASRCRYLLVEVRSDPGGPRGVALRGATSRSLLLCLRDAIAALHGEFGLASVHRSLSGRDTFFMVT